MCSKSFFSFILFWGATTALWANPLHCPPEANHWQSVISTLPSSPVLHMKTPEGAIERNWAHSRIGSSGWDRDLFGEEPAATRVGFADSGFDLSAIRDASGSHRMASFGDFEAQPHFHGTGVANTFFDFNQNAEMTVAWEFEDFLDSKDIRQRLDQMPSSQKPRILNISYAMGDNPEILSSLEAVNEAGILSVVSAGNFGDQRIHKNNREFEGVLVGSLSPFGLESDYSQTGAEVDILAPADYYLGVDFDGSGHQTASGTSFAAPIVSAILSEAVGILGENAPNDFLEELMKRTGLQTINGIPMINRDKLLATAARIKQQGLPLTASSLDRSELYDFSSESLRYQREAMAAYRSGDRLQAIEKMKTAFYLNQSNDSLRQSLIQLYQEAGLSGSAIFFESLTPDPAEKRKFLESYASNESAALGLQTSAARLLARMNGVSREIVAAKAPVFLEDTLSFQDKSLSQQVEFVEKVLAENLKLKPRDLKALYEVGLSSPNTYLRNLSFVALQERAADSLPVAVLRAPEKSQSLQKTVFQLEEARRRQVLSGRALSKEERQAVRQLALTSTPDERQEVQQSALKLLEKDLHNQLQDRKSRWVILEDWPALRPLVRFYLMSPFASERLQALKLLEEAQALLRGETPREKLAEFLTKESGQAAGNAKRALEESLQILSES